MNLFGHMIKLQVKRKEYFSYESTRRRCSRLLRLRFSEQACCFVKYVEGALKSLKTAEKNVKLKNRKSE